MTTTHNDKGLYPQKIYWNPTYEDRELNLEIYFTRVTPDKARQLMRTMDKNRPMRPCLLYTSPSPRDGLLSRMPSSA